MPNRHDIRRLAMQLLYQFDLRGDADREAVRESLEDGPDKDEVKAEAFLLAEQAWSQHRDADTLITELAPKWPTHRQPPVDRAILRLAYHEIATARTPFKVAINEAVEMAKEFGSDQSPAFVNGVLDKVARRITPAAPDEVTEPDPTKPSTGDAWLDDAISDAPAPNPDAPPA